MMTPTLSAHRFLWNAWFAAGRFLLAAGMLTGLAAGSLQADEEATVSASIGQEPPSGAILHEFNPPGGEPGIWGWMGTADAWRDIGMSFQSNADGEIRAVTLCIGKLPAVFTEPRRFTLRFYETGKISEIPNPATPLLTAQGEVMPERGDREGYLRLELDRGVPVHAGLVYTFLLSWDEPSSSQVIGFQTAGGYSEGHAWYREEAGGAMRFLSGSERTALRFFIQSTGAPE